VWLESPRLVRLGASDARWPTLGRLLATTRVRGPRVHAARVAAPGIAHGVTEPWSADRDLGRFAALKARNAVVRP